VPAKEKVPFRMKSINCVGITFHFPRSFSTSPTHALIHSTQIKAARFFMFRLNDSAVVSSKLRLSYAE
jgi:hypothetical protein